MSSEYDVPLGEAGRRYYEEKFADRIHRVRKSGRFPRGGSRLSGGAAFGIGLGVLFVILRIVVALVRTDSTPQYNYTSHQPNWQIQINQMKDQEVRNGIKRLRPPDVPPPLEVNPIRAENPALTDDEVPFVEGLCYRIHHESLRREPTPGGRICRFLDVSTRSLIAKAAHGQLLGEAEKADLLALLNEVLQRKDFYQASAFRQVPGIALLLVGRDPDADGEDRLRFNRLLFEKSYPEQIVPLRERAALQDKLLTAWELRRLEFRKRDQWQRRARADYVKAKQEYEPAKH